MRHYRGFRFLPCLQWTIFTTMLASMAMIVGCGGNAPYEYVKVSGKVTFEDGTPIKANEIRVVFVPKDISETSGGPKPRHGIANVKVEDGTFDSVTSHRYGDGILPGTHRVMVIVLDPKNPSEILPPEYADPDKTPLEVHTDDSPFHLKVKRLSAQ